MDQSNPNVEGKFRASVLTYMINFSFLQANLLAWISTGKSSTKS